MEGLSDLIHPPHDARHRVIDFRLPGDAAALRADQDHMLPVKHLRPRRDDVGLGLEGSPKELAGIEGQWISGRIMERPEQFVSLPRKLRAVAPEELVERFAFGVEQAASP